MRAMQNTTYTQWLLYCRAGFEQDCAQEALRQARQQKPVIAEQPAIIADSGYVIVALNKQQLHYRELIFARQIIRLHHTIESLPERDRLTPILSAVAGLPGSFGALWLEVPDTNDGKMLSAFARRFQPLLEAALRERGKLQDGIKNSVRPEPVEGHDETDVSLKKASTGSARTGNLLRLHIFFPGKATALIDRKSVV